MIKAVIFDMDGLLIDSEPLWQEAELEAFDYFGLRLNKKMCAQTMGLRVDEVIGFWQEKFPNKKLPRKKVQKRIMKNVLRLIEENGKQMKGVDHVMNFFKEKGLKIGIASSSQKILIKKVLKKLELERVIDFFSSAEDEEYGKPHPGVYLSCAKKLNEEPVNCLAFEDSINGIISAKAARMKCIAIPDHSIMGSKKLFLSDEILVSLADFNEMTWKRMNK